MRNVLVTGGNRGLGLGIARKLAGAEYHVIAVARKQTDPLISAIEEAERDHPGSFHFVPFDLAKIEDIAGFVKTLRKDFGPIYGLVNNAGVSFDGALSLMPNSQIEQLVRVNTLSPIVLTKYVVRSMMADGGGRIVNIASILGFTGYSGLSVYGATKASLIGFTRSLAHGGKREFGCARIRGYGNDARAQGRAKAADHAAQRAQAIYGNRGRGQRGRVPSWRQIEKHHRHGAHRRRRQYGMTGSLPKSAESGRGSPAKAWVRALERTASIARNPERLLPTVIEERAAQFGAEPALLSDRESLTYRALAERANRYARWALAQGLGKGDCVALLMPNRPEFMAIWLGISKAGGTVALLNTNLSGPSLAHCINIAAPKHLIVDADLVDAFSTALPSLTAAATTWVHGLSDRSFPRIDREIERHAGEKLNDGERPPLTIHDRALYIYTSGTTGLPKAANVSHARLMQWSHWFAGMMDARQTDRMYDCLPMYHSVGGVLAPGAILSAGGSVVIGEKFSASQFWNEVVRWDCTLIQYIGELCRYLLHTAPSPNDNGHRIRIACGNGLRPDVWEPFQSRFRIPQILEFYAATEGGISLFNVEGKCGAIGRVPAYLAHRFSPALVQFDVEKEQPVRNEHGFCMRCAANEIGEAIGKIVDDPSNAGSRFEGYTSREASEKKILRNVFEPGDAWVRTGDLMRQDEKGFFYFVDRIGDTFRWKGENVATSEISEAMAAFPGVKQANVYGVIVPGAEGRAGMASLVTEPEFDLPAFRAYLASRLPRYARPLFLRIRNEMEVTGTFKYTKTDLARQGYDPTATADVLYFDHAERQAFVRLDKALYDRIQAGEIAC
jgi:fatty-acyl-CoA synthase